MSEHTPGPWSVNETSTPPYVVDERGFIVAETSRLAMLANYEAKGFRHWADAPGHSYVERGDEELWANARLIAASPALKEACEAMWEMLYGDKPKTHPERVRVRELADSALALAAGETER